MSQRHGKTLVKLVVSIEEEIKGRISLGNKAFYANQDLFKSKLLTKNSKLKQSHYRPGQAQRVPGS